MRQKIEKKMRNKWKWKGHFDRISSSSVLTMTSPFSKCRIFSNFPITLCRFFYFVCCCVLSRRSGSPQTNHHIYHCEKTAAVIGDGENTQNTEFYTRGGEEIVFDDNDPHNAFTRIYTFVVCGCVYTLLYGAKPICYIMLYMHCPYDVLMHQTIVGHLHAQNRK